MSIVVVDARTHATTRRHPAVEFVLWLVWRVHAIASLLATAAICAADTATTFARNRQHGPYIVLIGVVLLLSIIPALAGH